MLLAHSGGWSYSAGDLVLGVALVTAQLVLLYAIGRLLGGPLFALLAGAVWIVAPLVGLRYWVVGGRPPTDFGPIFHEQFLPAAYGFDAAGAVAAGALLLLAGWLVLAPLSRATLAAAGARGCGRRGHALPPAPLARPRCAGARVCGRAEAARRARVRGHGARRPRCARALPRGAGHPSDLAHDRRRRRSVPRVLRGANAWSSTCRSRASFGLARRSAPAAVYFGWLFVTTIVFTLGRPLDLLALLLALVPGLPVYALLIASIAFVVPRVSASAARVTATAS